MTAPEPMPPIRMPLPSRRHPVAIAVTTITLIAVVASMGVLLKLLIGPLPIELAGSWTDGSASLELFADGTFESVGLAFHGSGASLIGRPDAEVHREGEWRIDQSATDEGRGVQLESLTASTTLLIKADGSGWRLIPVSGAADALTKR